MSKLQVYSTKLKTVKTKALPKMFGEEPNMKLLAQALRVYVDRAHVGRARVKSRGEVKRTTRKWYRQKGTGRARHGAQSAPIFVGGGVAHGPDGLKRKLSLSRKMQRKALGTALSLKAKAGEIVVAEGLSSLKKTKEADIFLRRILEGKKKFSVILSEKNKNAGRVIRNISGGKLVMWKDLNAASVYFGGVLIFDGEVFSKKGKK